MQRYSIGIKLDGYQETDVDTDEVIKDSLVVLMLSEESNGRLYDYYTFVKGLIVNNNRIILLMDDKKSKIRKQICMLLASYRLYDMYKVEDVNNVTESYIESLLDRKPSEDEVSTFIGSNITAYSNINELLLKMNDIIDKSDIDALQELIEQNRDKIEQFTDIIDYMKSVVDKVNNGDSKKEIESLQDKIESLSRELDSCKDSIAAYERDNSIISSERDMLQKEAFNAKKKMAEMEEQINNREPVIKSYSEIQTALIGCKTKVIIYFKEVSHISYISSFITQYMESLEQINKLRVKLLVYDNKTSFLSTYKIPVIGSHEYMDSRETIINKSTKLIVVEANQAIIEDTLKADWDVVIIYDRLRQDKDIVAGNNVHKYWVMNSLSEYIALKDNFNIDKSKVITRPGVMEEAITIREIDKYKSMTKSGKLSKYLTMYNAGSDKSKVFDIINKSTNVNTLKRI